MHHILISYLSFSFISIFNIVNPLYFRTILANSKEVYYPQQLTVRLCSMFFLPIALLLIPLAQSQAQERFTVHSSTRNMADAKQATQIRLLEKWASPMKMTITVNEEGNVGIGTDNPTRKLTIGGGLGAKSNNVGHAIHFLHSGADADVSLSWLELWGENAERREKPLWPG